MLWRAGQERVTRESRERLAELFVTARDAALDVLVATGQAKARGTWRLPPYIRSEEPVRRPTAERDAMLAKLAAMFPGTARRADS